MSASAPVTTPGPRAWVVLVALSLPMLVLSIDANGVVVLLPTIGSDLHVGADSMSAVVTVSSLAFAAPLVLIGRIADRVGARPMLLGGVAGFAVASAICAVAQTFPVLIAGRAIQGVASACCFATSLAAIDAIFDEARLPVAIGIWGAIGGVGGAAGPLVASIMGEVWSWRAFFGVNVVLLGIAFAMLAAMVPRLPADRTRAVPFARLFLLTFGLWMVTGAVQRAGVAGWFHAAVIGALAVGAGAFVLLWRRRGEEPLVSAHVTALPSFRVGVAEATLSNWGSGVIMVLIPIALQSLAGLGVLDTGLLFLAFSVPFAVGGAMSGPLTMQRGALAALGFGAATLSVGLVALGVVGVEGSLVPVAVALVVAGLGNGVVYSGSTSYALADVATSEAAEASATLNMIRVLGLALGIALSNSIMRVVDDVVPGTSAAALRVVLLVAAAVVALGVPLALRAARAVPSDAPPR